MVRKLKLERFYSLNNALVEELHKYLYEQQLTIELRNSLIT